MRGVGRNKKLAVTHAEPSLDLRVRAGVVTLLHSAAFAHRIACDPDEAHRHAKRKHSIAERIHAALLNLDLIHHHRASANVLNHQGAKRIDVEVDRHMHRHIAIELHAVIDVLLIGPLIQERIGHIVHDIPITFHEASILDRWQFLQALQVLGRDVRIVGDLAWDECPLLRQRALLIAFVNDALNPVVGRIASCQADNRWSTLGFVPAADALLDLVESLLLQLIHLIQACAVHLKPLEAVQVLVIIE